MRKIATILTLLAATPCFAAVRWAGDFESGNLNQWSKTQAVSNDRLEIVTDPVRQGKYALRALVKQGDDPINASGNRSELVQMEDNSEGTEVYYRWSTLFPESYPSAKAWQLFAQWHHPGPNGSPPLQFVVNGEQITLTAGMGQREVWRTKLERGVWHDFVLHVKWSNNSRVGFVELWYDGEHVLPKTYADTQANTYMKLGLYRSDTIQPDGVVYHDGMIRGDTLEDVMPPAPPAQAQPAPTPTPGAANNPDPGPLAGNLQPTAPTTVDPGTTVSPQEAGGGCSVTGSAPALMLGLLAGGALLRRRRSVLAVSNKK